MIEQSFAHRLDLSDEATVAAMNHGRYLRSAAFHSMAKGAAHGVASLLKRIAAAVEPHGTKAAH